jgi:hypothetical protein
MSEDDGLSAEMRRPFDRFQADPLALDDDSADRLLAGRLDPADAPPGYAVAAAVMAAASAPARPDELDGVESSLNAFRAALVPPPSSPRRPHMLVKFLTVRAAAAAFTGALLIGGVAAAATGELPDAAQRLAHSMVSAAPAPAGDDHAQGSVDSAKGPDVTGAAKAGLCTAYMAGKGGANGGKNDSVAFKALEQAAGGADKVADFCKDATSHSAGTGAASSAGQAQSASDSAGGPDLSAIDKAGLCKAWAQRHGSQAQGDAAAFQTLEQAAGGADKVADYCKDVTVTTTQGQQSGGTAGDHTQNVPPASSDHSGGQG